MAKPTIQEVREDVARLREELAATRMAVARLESALRALDPGMARTTIVCGRCVHCESGEPLRCVRARYA